MSLLGGLIGGIGGFITGGPIGAVTGAITGSRGSQQNPMGTGTQFPQSMPSPFGPVQGFINKLNPFQPGGFPGFGPLAGFGSGARGRGRVDPINGRCPQGYHPAKDGKGCVRNRHMNFGNGRATSRSIRRIRGAEKQYSRIFHMTHRKTGVRIKRKR